MPFSWTTPVNRLFPRLSPVSSTYFWDAGPTRSLPPHWRNQRDSAIAKAFNKATKYVVTQPGPTRLGELAAHRR